MDECTQISNVPDQESIEKVVTQISPHQKTMDPSSVGFVYHWMFSMMASALNLNKLPNINNENNIILDNNSNNNNNNNNLKNKKIKSENDSNNNNNNINENSTNKDGESCIQSLNEIILSSPECSSSSSSSSLSSSSSSSSLSSSLNIEESEKIKNCVDDCDHNQHQNENKEKCINQENINNQNNNTSTIQHFNEINSLNIQNLNQPKKTLILDLDETLVHSTLKPVTHNQITVKVLIEDMDCTFYVIKRPHVDYFLEKVSQWYDIVIFTASMQQYADPLLDQLDTHKVFKKRLFRDSCLEKHGNFVKDLSMIDQDLTSTIIIDNSPIAYSNNLENALPIDNWMGDNPSDTSLLSLLPFLEMIRHVQDVRSILSLRLINSIQ
ncbi:hypothetical protein ACTFIR_011295 [Dictyostelium discoideum]